MNENTIQPPPKNPAYRLHKSPVQLFMESVSLLREKGLSDREIIWEPIDTVMEIACGPPGSWPPDALELLEDGITTLNARAEGFRAGD